MTIRDMTEIQYLGLMLNVCSGALPEGTLLDGPGGFEGTVAEAIANIEAALNSGEDLDEWKTVADDINNRVGVVAADCEEGDDLFRNIEPCGDVGGAGLLDTQAASGPGDPCGPIPNPVLNGGTSDPVQRPRLSGGSCRRAVRVRRVRTSGPEAGGRSPGGRSPHRQLGSEGCVRTGRPLRNLLLPT